MPETELVLFLEASARNYFLVAWAHDIQGDAPSALTAIDRAVTLPVRAAIGVFTL